MVAMQVAYTIFDSMDRVVFDEPDDVCYSAMRALAQTLGWKADKPEGDPEDISYITFKINIEENVDISEGAEWVKEVHGTFNKYILNSVEDILETSIVKVDLTKASGNVFLAIATLFRVFDEMSWTFKSFDYLVNELNCDRDIALIYAPSFMINDDSVDYMNPNGHSLYSWRYEPEAIKQFRTRKWEDAEKPYSTERRYSGMTSMFLGNPDLEKKELIFPRKMFDRNTRTKDRFISNVKEVNKLAKENSN